VTDSERLKYYAARRVWPVRDEATPLKSKLTWGAWFMTKYGEDLEAYVERCLKDDLRAKVLAYELATYGKSALQDSLPKVAA
jgi:hypothetical protein